MVSHQRAFFRVALGSSYYRGLEDISVGYNRTVYITDEFGTSSRYGGVLVFPPGKTKPTNILSINGFYDFYGVATDYDNDVFAAYQSFTSGDEGILEFPKGSDDGELLPAEVGRPDGIGVTANGDLAVCDGAGVQTFALDATQPKSTIAVSCSDISLANNGHSIWVVGTNQSVQRYSYPDGKLEVTLQGIDGPVSVAAQGSVSD